MTREMEFFLFLVERYAERCDMTTGDVVRQWDERGITDEIFNGYFQYHQEALDHAYADIDSLVVTGEHAY